MNSKMLNAKLVRLVRDCGDENVASASIASKSRVSYSQTDANARDCVRREKDVSCCLCAES